MVVQADMEGRKGKGGVGGIGGPAGGGRWGG